MYDGCVESREGMATETLNKQSSVEWRMATPDPTIQRMAAWPIDDNGAWVFTKKNRKQK